MGERSARERDAADGLPGLERPHLGDDAPLAQVGHEQIEAAELEVAAEDGSDRDSVRMPVTPKEVRASGAAETSPRACRRGGPLPCHEAAGPRWPPSRD